MANQEQLDLLRQGVEIWNQWRQEFSSNEGANLECANSISADLEGADLEGADLEDANLRGSSLIRADLGGAHLSGADLSNANLKYANLSNADLEGADLSNADLSMVDLGDANLIEANLNGANLSGSGFIGADLSSANLSGADLSDSNLISADLSSANLSGANFSSANLSGANLSSADLEGANLSNADLSSADLEGANLSNANLSSADLEGANLSDANLSGINLSDANLSGIDLSGDKFSRVDLSSIDLWGVKLRGVNLSKIDLSKIDFSDINLRELDLGGIDFRGVNLSEIDIYELRDLDLSQMNFRDADLHSANLSDGNLNGMNLSNANLSGADFTRTQALATNFTGATFTGVCLEDWNINSKTNLNGVICEYVYLKQKQQERRPSSGSFKPGEFTALFQKALETVDLIFADGIDWKAFFASFQQLQAEYEGDDLSIQAIEKKSGSAFVIRLEVLAGADKVAIEQQAKELYEMKLQLMEVIYHGKLKEQEVESYKRENTRVDRIVERLAKGEKSKVSINENQLKVLQAINTGINNSSTISKSTEISIHIVRYYIEILQSENYLQCTEFNDGISTHNDYLCQLTSKGRVAIENPELLLPLRGEVANQSIHNDLRGASIGNFANQVQDHARQVASNFAQNIGQNLGDITKLINSLRETAQAFPEGQREETLGHLGDLEDDLKQPINDRTPRRIKAILAALLASAGMVAASTDFSNNVLEISNKLGIELIQPHKQQLPPSSK